MDWESPGREPQKKQKKKKRAKKEGKRPPPRSGGQRRPEEGKRGENKLKAKLYSRKKMELFLERLAPAAPPRYEEKGWGRPRVRDGYSGSIVLAGGAGKRREGGKNRAGWIWMKRKCRY